MKRSFNQRTLVMISHHNFPSFHHQLLHKMTETGVISDPVTLQAAYNQMFAWHLYVLYEKLVLCESIIVIAKSPQLASEAVSSLLDLICPVPYAGVVKPYMTMQADFKSIGIDGGTPQSFIIGITNPFLLKRIVAAAEASHRMRPHILYLQNFDGPVPTRRHHSIHHKSSRNALLDLPGGGIEVHTPPKRFLKSDPLVVSRIEAMLKLGDQTRDIGPIIRRHFAELTAQFVAPLNRYLATSNVVTPGGNHRYASFSIPEFLSSSKGRTICEFLQFGKLLLVAGNEAVA
ncbi:hypothetical protein SNOG_03042 [Parastagonospora nodorum SN15]|uniref:UDENN domain-containing protein n=1 Tax=Phaeosphaeria nodorum (strain SN15 / ATCC MYA-4574 / FGSC 10173) TaxID=321614 RepID=Q0UYX2_PHANO|nr:hypothetical protein SNOG_03042 [Parastagonospora nodorum SN15]EAT89773.2 hypothetical protein SNOG_03042 [Parastagonospora nodorum SN15]